MTSRRPHLRRVRKTDEGNAAVEAAILFPFILLLVIMIIQVAVFYHARNTAQSAANGGAVVGAARDGSAAEAEAEAWDRIDRAGGYSLLDDYAATATRTGTEVTVRVEGTAKTFVPGLPPLTVTRTVSAPVERFTTP